ncbi:RNA-directed DNA polymerase from mobile element jockey [Trichonephila clavipes]|nr:RNA-directed DNA polymerase from mobile element jockey [Trichonephila clavipes]
MFGTRIAFEPYDGSRNRRLNQCWRCQRFFHSSEVCHLPMKCLKCAGPHQAKDCTLQFEVPSNARIAVRSTQLIGGNVRVFQEAKSLQTTKRGNIKNNNPKPYNKNINQRNQILHRSIRSNSTRAQLRPNAHSLAFNSNVQSWSICFWNANGLRPKICQVRDFVSEQSPDLLLVQETKLQPGIDPLIANYRLHKDDRNNFPRTRTDGGTAIYCKNNYDHNRVPLPTLQSSIRHSYSIYWLCSNQNSGSTLRQLGELQISFNKPLPIPPSSSNDDLEIAIRRHGENIYEALIEALKPKFKQPPLKLSSEIKAKIRHRNSVRKFWQRTRDPAVKSEFRTLSREVTKDIRHFSQFRWESHIVALTSETGTLWRKKSPYSKNRLKTSPPIKGALGSVANHPLEKAEVIAASFKSSSNPTLKLKRTFYSSYTKEY